MMDLNNLTQAIEKFNTATTASDAEITNAITAKLNEIKNAQKAREKVVTKLATAMSLTEEEVEQTFGSTLTPKVDVNAEEARLRAEAKSDLDQKKELSFYDTLEKLSKLDAAVSAIEHEREIEKLKIQANIASNQPKSSIDKLCEMLMVKEFMNMNAAPAPAPVQAPVAPVPAPAPTTEAATPATITTRKDLNNELRAISAEARAERALIHADSIKHPLSGNYKEWGSSLFQELADRATARSEYWRNR